MKKTLKSIIVLSVIVCGFAQGTTAKAAQIGQSAETTNSITITWQQDEDAEHYYIGYGEEYSAARDMADQKKIVLPKGTGSYTISNLKPGTEYEVRITYDYKSSYSSQMYDSAIGTFQAKTAPAKVSNVHQAKWWYFIENVDIEWDDQTAATFECVVTDNKGKKIAENKDLRSARFNVTNVKNTKVYEAKVRSKVVVTRLDGKEYTLTSDWSDNAYLFTQPMVNTAKISGGKLKVTWKKVSGCTGYDVFVSTKEKSGYKKVKSLKANKNSVTISKFKGKKFSKKKTYFIYIVGKKKVGKATYDSGRHYTYSLKKGNGKLNWTFD